MCRCYQWQVRHPCPPGTDGSKRANRDGNWSFTFTKAGEFTYHCEPHPWMKGKVVVVENFS
ncbi:MAG TPA: plastocyanin/azurin family copper-binding protein [Nitrososphaera sp.]|nr:plastocyanin/azurin family copper-binding protein [Nitrososphaera sp.]